MFSGNIEPLYRHATQCTGVSRKLSVRRFHFQREVLFLRYNSDDIWWSRRALPTWRCSTVSPSFLRGNIILVLIGSSFISFQSIAFIYSFFSFFSQFLLPFNRTVRSTRLPSTDGYFPQQNLIYLARFTKRVYLIILIFIMIRNLLEDDIYLLFGYFSEFEYTYERT
jgi:hypothetical protein